MAREDIDEDLCIKQTRTQEPHRSWDENGVGLNTPAGSLPTTSPKQALTWNPEGKRKRGRLRSTRRRDAEAEMQRSGHSWKDTDKTAQSRGVCRVPPIAYAPHWTKGLSKYVGKIRPGVEQRPHALEVGALTTWYSR